MNIKAHFLQSDVIIYLHIELLKSLVFFSMNQYNRARIKDLHGKPAYPLRGVTYQSQLLATFYIFLVIDPYQIQTYMKAISKS